MFSVLSKVLLIPVQKLKPCIFVMYFFLFLLYPDVQGLTIAIDFTHKIVKCTIDNNNNTKWLWWTIKLYFIFMRYRANNSYTECLCLSTFKQKTTRSTIGPISTWPPVFVYLIWILTNWSNLRVEEGRVAVGREFEAQFPQVLSLWSV